MSPEHTKPSEPPRPTILVIDDSHAACLIVEGALAELGYDVISAQQGAEGIRLALKHRPECILLDVAMPGVDGLRTCEILRRHQEFAGIPIIMYSAQDTRNDVLEALKRGASDYIVKPATIGVIRDKVSKALGDPPSEQEAVVVPTSDPSTWYAGDIGAAVDAAVADHGLLWAGEDTATSLVRRLSRLRPIPHAAMVAVRPESDIDDVVRGCRSDPAIASGILQLANSAAFGTRRRITSLREAVLRVGLKHTRRRILQMGMYKLVTLGGSGVAFDRLAFWLHSVSCAALSHLLAGATQRSGKELAYLAGLLHDVGKLVFDEVVPTRFLEAVTLARKKKLPMLEAERRVLGTDHVEVGVTLATEWGFPDEVRQAIERHHGTDGGNGEADSVLDAVIVANAFAKAFHAGTATEPGFAEPCLGTAARLGSLLSRVRGLETELRAELRDTQRFLGAKEGTLDDVGDGPPKPAGDVAVWFSEPRPASVCEIVLRKKGFSTRRLGELDDWDGATPLLCHVASWPSSGLDLSAADGATAPVVILLALAARDTDRTTWTLPQGVEVMAEPYRGDELATALGVAKDGQ